MKARLAAALAVLCCCCGTEEQPPFRFVAYHQGASVVDQAFTSYEVALDSAPYIIQVVEGTTPYTLTLEVGHCRGYTCTGPLTQEELHVVPSPPYLSLINRARCFGLDGALEHDSIDSFVGVGDCAD